MNKAIYAFSDLMSQPLAFVALTGGTLIAIACGIALDLPDGYWTSLNLSISVSTMAIGQAVLVSSRRDGLAVQLKLDHAIEALPRDNDAIGVEHEDEQTIQQKIKETEDRTNDGSKRGTS